MAVYAWEGHDEWFVFGPRDLANLVAVGEEHPLPRRDPEEDRERNSEARMEGQGFDKYTSYYAPDAVSPDGDLYATTGGCAIFLLDLTDAGRSGWPDDGGGREAGPVGKARVLRRRRTGWSARTTGAPPSRAAMTGWRRWYRLQKEQQ